MLIIAILQNGKFIISLGMMNKTNLCCYCSETGIFTHRHSKANIDFANIGAYETP